MSKKSKKPKKNKKFKLKPLTPEEEAEAEAQYIERLTMPFCPEPLTEEEIEDMRRRGVI